VRCINKPHSRENVRHEPRLSEEDLWWLTRLMNRNLDREQPDRFQLLNAADRSLLTGPALAAAR
jgi:hypothetical protein